MAREAVGAAVSAGASAMPQAGLPTRHAGTEAPSVALRYCAVCGALVQAHTPFCGMCGSAVQPLAVPTHAGSEVVSAPPIIPAFGYVPPRISYAGFWLRLVALFFDSIVLVVGTFVAVVLIVAIMYGASRSQPSSDTAGSITYIAFAALSWLYYTVMESSSKQATLGKMLLRLKVTDENGRRISFGRANGRFWGKTLSSFVFCAGYIMAGLTQKKQALHDKLSGCLVVAIRR